MFNFAGGSSPDESSLSELDTLERGTTGSRWMGWVVEAVVLLFLTFVAIHFCIAVDGRTFPPSTGGAYLTDLTNSILDDNSEDLGILSPFWSMERKVVDGSLGIALIADTEIPTLPVFVLVSGGRRENLVSLPARMGLLISTPFAAA